MSQKIYLSVIIPFYNRFELLEKTLQSFNKIKEKNFEIILVDDGSISNPLSILNKYINNNVKYYRIENSERGYARNFGANKSNGEYLNFFDSDDLVLENHIYSFINFIKKNNSPNIFTNSYSVVDYKKKIKKNIILEGILNNKIFKKNILSCNSVFIKKKCFDKYKFSENIDLSGSEDWDLWLRIANNEIFYGNKIISTVINNHLNRSTIKQDLDKILKRINVLNESIFNKKSLTLNFTKYRHIKSEIFSFKSLTFSFYKNKKSTTFFYFLSSLLYRPTRIFDKRNIVICKNILLSII